MHKGGNMITISTAGLVVFLMLLLLFYWVCNILSQEEGKLTN